jgi:hypothetical protein
MLIVTKSGDLALGECKRLRWRRNFNPVAKAFFQLSGYERAIPRSPHGWLEKRIDDDYSKFGFPKFVEALRLLGLRSERQQRLALRQANVEAGGSAGSSTEKFPESKRRRTHCAGCTST